MRPVFPLPSAAEGRAVDSWGGCIGRSLAEYAEWRMRQSVDPRLGGWDML